MTGLWKERLCDSDGGIGNAIVAVACIAKSMYQKNISYLDCSVEMDFNILDLEANGLSLSWIMQPIVRELYVRHVSNSSCLDG
ncbi:hypothetical protein [Sphingobium yanoikuyae]|uniref:hypothetical protein n=1 Tax=Sphingobium yanoikuyae TaxID=13690 RepID=UPI00138E52A7|nr:hypothetical protein [Sphingobium yanoikuyae]